MQIVETVEFEWSTPEGASFVAEVEFTLEFERAWEGCNEFGRYVTCLVDSDYTITASCEYSVDGNAMFENMSEDFFIERLGKEGFKAFEEWALRQIDRISDDA